MNKYQSYKPSGIEWIGDIPIEWKVSKYKYNLTILSGFPFKSELFDNENGFPLLRIRDITSGTIETYYNGDFDKKYIIKKGDVVIGMDGDFNIREWDNDDILLNQRCCKIQGYDNLLLKFIYYTLPIDLKIINDLTYYTTVKHLSVDDLYNINCVLPSLNEQYQIVQFLDGKTELIDKLISTKERKITLLKEQRTTLINQVVTKGLNPNVKMKDSGVEWIGEIPEHWSVLKINHFGVVTLGKMLTPDEKEGYVYKPYLRSQNIQKERVDVSDVKEMWFSKSELQKLKLLKGDLLLNEGGDVGRTCIWNEELEECYIQNSVNRLRFIDDLQEYYLYLSNIYHYVGYYDSIVNRVSIPHLTKEKLESVKFIRPPRKEQFEIVEHLDSKTKEIDELLKLEQKKIDLLTEYRQSLISEVVTGKIKVTTDE
jgi:type I restriction enzyme S subunit